MRPEKRVYDFYSEEHKEFIERIFDVINNNLDGEVVDDKGFAMQYDAHNGSDFYMFSNYYPIIAWAKGSYQFGDVERKAVDEFIDRCYKDAEEEGVDLEANEYEKEIGWLQDEYDYESQYGWYIRFYLDFGEYPDYPEDGYVLYAEFIDGNGNKHISDNTAFITMNDDEDTIEKKVSRFMDNLKFSDKNNLRESKTIKEAVKVPSSAKKKGNDLIKGIEELYRISETKPNDWLQMYDENDWSFYIKDYKFNDKNMTFTWKEKSGELHNDRSVSNEKEKFVANGEFDFYGEFNDFVNYWNKLVRKTKKYLEMDSTELDRKLGYDVDDDELNESKKVVKESESDEEYRKRTFKTNMESIENFIQKADSRNDKVIESLASAIRVSRYYSEDKYDEEFKDLLDRLRKIYEIFKGNGEELYDLVGDISYYIQNNIKEN